MKKFLKHLSFLIFAVILLSCSNSKKENLSDEIWKGNPQTILTKSEIAQEINYKIELLKKFLSENNIGGILFTQVRNVNWITAGLANNQIVLNKDIGAASLLIMKDGKKYLLCNGAESGRLMDETLKELGYELKFFNWFESNSVKDLRGEIIKQIAGTASIGSDIDFPNTINIANKFKPLRFSFTEAEIKRYRWLGEQTTLAVAEVCKKIKPNMNEFEIEAITAAELRSRGILPTVLLTSVDGRIYKYRHALPGGEALKNYAMINVVAEKWGMPIAVTRFVFFGNKIPDDLKNKLEKTAIVNAHYQEASKVGVDVNNIWEACKLWYSEVGFNEEWKLHHQGGAIGYDDREYVIWQDNHQLIQINQPFAWNPTITGAKVEETMIVTKDGFEVVTKSKDWPMIIVQLNGKKYPQPSILLRNEKTFEIIPQKDYEINEK